jgi:hypothetical protein
LTLRRNEIWCTVCCEDGHTKDTCSLNDQVTGATDAQRVQAETYCNICETLTDHTVQDFPHNLKNTKWCHICESHNHRTSECRLNAQNRTNVHTVYHTEETDQNNDYGRRNDYYGRGRGGFQGRSRGRGRGRPYYFNCWKEDHISPDFPIKDRVDLKFCNICGVDDHSLEDFPIVLDKIMNKKTVNLLHRVPKQEVLNSKNLHIVTRSGAG